MKGKWVLLFVACVAPLILVAAVAAGGWVIVTVCDVPEYAVVGKPLQLAFMVRRIDGSPMDGLTPNIAAKSRTKMVKASAVPTKKPGEYAATLVLPSPENWTVRFNAFADSSPWESSTLPELTVTAPGSPAPLPLSQATLGARLFNAKGCVGCHSLIRANEFHIDSELQDDPGSDLSGKRFPEAYLKKIHANPRAALALDSKPQLGDMPNLGLTQSEIEALTAFINRERRIDHATP
jgi:hypothetical protein